MKSEKIGVILDDLIKLKYKKEEEVDTFEYL